MPNKPRLVLKNCLICGDEFSVRMAYHKKGIGNYCSPKCRGASLKGRKGKPMYGADNPAWKGGISLVESTQNYRTSNPKKYECHRKVTNALRSGKLVRKPCKVCGERKSQGHHCDYDKPLDVMWLCQKHHSEWHIKNGEGKNAT